MDSTEVLINVDKSYAHLRCLLFDSINNRCASQLMETASSNKCLCSECAAHMTAASSIHMGPVIVRVVVEVKLTLGLLLL